MALSHRMTSGSERSGPRAGKRTIIMRAARDVLGRDGCARTRIATIPMEPGVSTRTIHDHFAGQEQLFSDVLHDSAGQVADGFVAAVAQTVAGAGLPGAAPASAEEVDEGMRDGAAAFLDGHGAR
jgi:AcrR family transcriptional regulator